MPIYTLSWDRQVRNIPLDKPVLVCQFGERVPFMAVREEGNQQVVNILLGTEAQGYGHYVDLDQIAAWVDPGDHPGNRHPKDTRVAP